jgi:hypothetical protein
VRTTRPTNECCSITFEMYKGGCGEFDSIWVNDFGITRIGITLEGDEINAAIY